MASICSLGIMGTRYVRDDPLPERIEVLKDEILTISIQKAYSEFQIGTQIDMKQRQKVG